MEVDLHSASSSVDSRHSSPFQRASASTSPFPVQLVDRKRRRSVQLFNGCLPSANGYGNSQTYAAGREDDDDSAGPAKRRHTLHPGDQIQDNHHYSALGSAYDIGGAAFEADYSFDSPMHSLSLASPSPPGEPEGRNAQTDVDMGEGESLTTATSQMKASTAFVPRQLRHTSLLRSGIASTIPLKPSPLNQSERFLSSSTISTSSSGDPTSSQSTSTDESVTKKNLISTHSDTHSSSCNSPASSQPLANRTKSHHNMKIRESPLMIARTPSPSPLPSSPSLSEEDDRKLHYSPGLSQSTFPGGKHMLRYTMGYREDCFSCQNKTPGHYGHVLHR